MLKTTLKITALSVATLTLLTACGSGGGTGTGGSGTGTGGGGGVTGLPERVVTIPTSVLSDGTAAVADGVSSYRQAYYRSHKNTDTRNDDTFHYSRAETQDTFSLRAGEGNTAIMTVNGAEHTFTFEGSNGVGTYNDDINFQELVINIPFSNSDPVQGVFNVLDGTHTTIQGTYASYETDNGSGTFHTNYTRGFATVGIQTTPEQMVSQSAVATYRGSIILDLNPLAQTFGIHENPFNDNSALFAELIMTVNFNTNNVTGTAASTETDFSVQPDENGAYPTITNGIITFGIAPIVGNGFAGEFTIDGNGRDYLGLTDNPTGNYTGNFFGPDADDIAGVMRFNGTTADGATVGIGGFRGDRQEPAQ